MTVLFTDGREMPLSEGLAAIRREYPDAAAYDQLLDPLGIDTVLVWADEAASLDDPGGNSIAKITTNEEEAKP